MYDSPISQLHSSLLLASLSLIPNHVLRLVALAAFLTLALVHLICLQRPSSQLASLEAMIEKTEKVVDHAKMLCRIGFLQVVLAEENVRLLEAQRSASVIRCCLLETRICTWQKYRLLSREISACVSDVNKVLGTSQARAPFFLFGKLIDFSGPQLILEAERQRKYAEDIDEAKIMLNRAQLMSNGPDYRSLVPASLHQRVQSNHSYGGGIV
ncbi:hypothetical protein GGX14DRAFT_563595 [Mycena pura]|uniref:Uncharacterized protein n=1 Tax=Mycena pura TaxID=153505 RepID=A0AAD6YJ29_9AGAR|nr:hypothetical protein GGX14DRAFT_563595 [Mycena pura]